MLRKVYSQVFGMLILSTIILIFTLGWGVYSQLSWQLTRDGQAALQAEVSEVQYSISESHGGQQALAVSSLTDDRGQNIYFIVLHNGHVFIKTMNPIVPVQKVESFSKSKGFKIFQYQGLPYRVLSATVNENNSVYRTLIYTNILQEQHTLLRMSQLMLGMGVIGLLLSIGINLFVASRAIEPARRTWKAYQDSMVELSHELQTPLATAKAILQSSSDLLLIKNNLHVELDRASEMVRNILYLSRLRSHDDPTSCTVPVAVSDVTEDTIERFKPLAAKRGIGFIGKATQGLFVDTSVEAWDRLVSTVLKNVVDHALENSNSTWSLNEAHHTVKFVVQNSVSVNQRKEEAIQEFVHGIGLQIIERLASQMKGTAVIQKIDLTVTVIIEVPQARVKLHKQF